MTTTPIGLPLIETFLDRGNDADLPSAATVNANTDSRSTCIFYAEDTTTFYVLNRTSIAWDAVVTGGSGITQLTGDVAAGPGSGSVSSTIQTNAVTTTKVINDAITNAKLANMPAQTFKMNSGLGAADPQDATYATVAAALAPYFPGNNYLSTIAYTADHTLDADEVGFWFYNTGAAGAINFTLPATAAGLVYRFVVAAAQYLKVTADGTDVILFEGDTSAAGGYIRSNVVGSVLEVMTDGSGSWVVSRDTGSWSLDA